jgi:hypothetical protein
MVQLQLENIRHKLVAEGNLFQCPAALLALRCSVALLAVTESSSTTAAEIEALSASALAEYNH